MRLAIVEYSCNFKETFERLSRGQDSTYHTHSYVFEFMLQLSRQIEEAIYVCCCTAPRQDTLLQPGLRSLNAALDPYQQLDELTALLDAQNLTHIVIQFPHRQLIDWAVRKKIKTITVFADSFEMPGWQNQIKNWMLARSLNRPQVEWVGNHGINSSRSIAGIGVKPEKIVPYDWVYARTPNQFLPKSHPTSAPWQLLYVGALDESKGIGDVICAIAELKKRQIPVVLNVAGRGEMEPFRDLVQQLAVEDQVEFLGLVPHQTIYSLMREADAIVVPSRHEFPEGFPLTIYEALCTRTPLIASDHPMFEGVLRDRKTALIFPEQNAIALADCVAQLVHDPQLYEQLSLASEEAWQQLQISVKWGDLLLRWLSNTETDHRWLSEHSLSALPQTSSSSGSASSCQPELDKRSIA